MWKNVAGALSLIPLCSCALVAPSFDIPTDESGIQRTRTIVERIRCELWELVRNDTQPPPPLRESLLRFDYQFAAALYLDVNNKAGLTPLASFPDTAKYVFDIGAQLDQSRQDSVTVNIAFSMREIARDLQDIPRLQKCPPTNTNLSGDLGLKRRAEMAMTTPYNTISNDIAPDKGEFSGTISFISTYAITGAGPTWTFRHFRGLGQFGSASSVYTDRLTYAFASGKNSGRYLSGVPLARRLIVEQNQNDALSQLSALRNTFR